MSKINRKSSTSTATLLARIAPDLPVAVTRNGKNRRVASDLFVRRVSAMIDAASKLLEAANAVCTIDSTPKQIAARLYDSMKVIGHICAETDDACDLIVAQIDNAESKGCDRREIDRANRYLDGLEHISLEMHDLWADAQDLMSEIENGEECFAMASKRISDIIFDLAHAMRVARSRMPSQRK